MAEPNGTTWQLRELVAAFLREHYPVSLNALLDSDSDAFPNGVPEFKVVPFRRTITADLPCYVIDMLMEELTRADGGGNRRGHQLSLHLISPYQEADEDGELDAMLSALLDCLTTTSGGLRWTRAVYAIRDETYPAYSITLNLEEL